MAGNNFYFLFAGLILLLLLDPFVAGMEQSNALMQLAFTSMICVGVFSLSENARVFRVGLGLAAAGFVSAAGYFWTDSQLLRVIDLIAVLSFCALAIGTQLRQIVLLPGSITRNRILGALCLYLMIGVLWSVLFTLVEMAAPGAFIYSAGVPSESLDELLYYSFVTLTTLGYGDVTPLHPVARTLSFLLAALGQLYIAVLIAGLVGLHVAERVRSSET